MKKFFQVILAGVFFASTSNAAEATAENNSVQKMLAEMNSGSLSLKKIFARELRNDNSKAFYQELDMMAYNGHSAVNSTRALSDNYLNLKASQQRFSYVLTGSVLALKGAIKYAEGRRSPTGIQAMAFESAPDALDFVKDKIVEHMNSESLKLLSSDLETYRQAHNGDLSQLTGLSAPQVYVKLFGEEPPADIADFERIEGELDEKSVIALSRLRLLQDRIVKNELVHMQTRQLTQAEIQESKEQIVAVNRTFTQFAKETKQDIESLYQTQIDIQVELTNMNEQVEQNTKDIEKNARDIGFMQEFLLGKMSAQEQHDALEKGMEGNLSPDQVKEKKKQLEIVIKRQQFEETAGKILTGANDLIKIASFLNVDRKILDAAQTAVGVGTTAMNVMNMLSGTPNYLGAVAAVTSLFGGGSRDIAGERHEEIMNALKQVLEGQQQILQTLEEGFNRVFENQQKILEAISFLSVQIDQNHRQNMEKLFQIQNDVILNRNLILSLLQEDLSGCRTLIDNRQEPQFGFRNGGFPSYDALVRHHYNNDAEFSNCLGGLIKKFGYADGIHPQFNLTTYAKRGEGGPTAGYVEKVYDPAWTFLKDVAVTEGRNLTQLTGSLFVPMTTLEGLDEKLQHLDQIQVGLDLLKTDFFHDPLSVDAIEKAVNYLIEVHPYFEILDRIPEGKPYPLAELRQIKSPRTKGKEYLEKSLNVVSVAIAQQNLLSGDLLLPVMAKHIVNKEVKKPEAIDKNDFLGGLADAWSDPAAMTWDALTFNPILARNVAMYILQHELKSQDSAVFYKYYLGLSSTGDDAFLQDIFKHKIEFYYANKNLKIQTAYDGKILAVVPERAKVREQNIKQGWSAVIGGHYIPMPSAEEVVDADFQHTTDMEILLRLKSRLIDAIMEYDYVKSADLTPAQLTDFNLMLMKGI